MHGYIKYMIMIQIGPFAWGMLALGSMKKFGYSRKPVHAIVDSFAINDRASDDAPIPISEFTQFQSF